jgi:hypothetical protein
MRRGEGDGVTISRTAAKRDRNEPAVIRAARALGAVVLQQSGEGLPDLLVCHAGRTHLVEVKMPGEPLKPAQAETFAALHAVGVAVYVVERTDDMLAILARRAEPWAPNSRAVEGVKQRPHRPGVDRARTVGELCIVDGCPLSMAPRRMHCLKHLPTPERQAQG